LQIGANVIDQWDADSYPTAIQILDGNNFTFSGIENLPYLTRIFSNTFKDGVPPAEFMHFFLHPEIWNPHQNADSPPSQPNSFRFVMEGSYFSWVDGGAGVAAGTLSADGTRGITFAGSASFSEPKLLDYVGTAIDPRDSKSPTIGSPFVAMLMGSFTPVRGNWSINLIIPNPTLSYHLQYLRDGSWITYSSMRNHMHRFLTSDPSWSSNGSYPSIVRYWIGRSDPRVERFGFIMSYDYGGTGSGTKPNETQRPDYTNVGAQVWDNSKWDTYPGWHPLNPNVGGWQWAYCWGLLTGNKPASSTWYADADGQNRLGDAAFSSGANGEPMQAGNLPSRPAILNRPFRSVAEMGYAGRDMPWKTLDLFTQASADSPLLDAFMLSDTGPSEIVAGAVNLNTRQTPVLQAILSGAAKTPASSLTATAAQNLASRITTITSTAPLDTKAALANTVTANATLDLGSVTDGAIKTRREVVTRALGDVGQVRTWNLLVDGVAQSGQFVGGTAAGDFLVQAEQRFWKSLAIDRPTATVISSQTETVNE